MVFLHPGWENIFDGFHSCYEQRSFYFRMIFIGLALPYLWPAIWVLPPWQWQQQWGLRQRSGIVVPFWSSCSTMAPTRRGGMKFLKSELLLICLPCPKSANYVTEGKQTITLNWDLRSTSMMGQKGPLCRMMLAKEIVMLDDNSWSRSCSCTIRWSHSLQRRCLLLSQSLLNSIYSLLQVLSCTQKRASARSSSPTLGLVQPSVGGPGPFSEGIPLLSGRGGQIFTGRGSLPFPFPSWQDEKVNLFFEGFLRAMLE